MSIEDILNNVFKDQKADKEYLRESLNGKHGPDKLQAMINSKNRVVERCKK